MIITIDTEKDRPERLRQAAEFLLRLAGEPMTPRSEPAAVAEAAPEPERYEIDEGMLNIFNEPEPEPQTKPDDDFRVLPY